LFGGIIFHLLLAVLLLLSVDRLYPPLSSLKEISIKIASKVAIEAYKDGSASTYPEPEDKESFIRQQLYDYSYDDALPSMYQWPSEAFAKIDN